MVWARDYEGEERQSGHETRLGEERRSGHETRRKARAAIGRLIAGNPPCQLKGSGQQR